MLNIEENSKKLYWEGIEFPMQVDKIGMVERKE